MRAMMRFLVLGAVVFGWLLGGIQPAHADDDLEAGNYIGEIDLAFHLRSSQEMSVGGQTFKGSVTINWFGNGLFTLTITNAEHGLVKISALSVDIFDNAFAEYSGKCYASVGIKAKGNFEQLTDIDPDNLPSNFNPKGKVGKVILIFNGLEGHEITHDNVQGCWRKSMSTSQLIALEQTSEQIGKNLTITVTLVEEGFLRGSCSMPDWEGSGGLPNGSYDHIVDSCSWWALQEGEREWKNK